MLNCTLECTKTKNVGFFVSSMASEEGSVSGLGDVSSTTLSEDSFSSIEIQVSQNDTFIHQGRVLG